MKKKIRGEALVGVKVERWSDATACIFKSETTLTYHHETKKTKPTLMKQRKT